MMSNSIGEMTAQTFAAQTAVLALLVEMLIERQSLDRLEVVDGLYDLLAIQSSEGITDGRSGPIRHLISLIEKP